MSTCSTCPVSSMLLLQGPPVEVTKSQFFRVHAQITGCTCAEREIHLSLLYDGCGDLSPVPPAMGHEVIQGKTVSHTANEFVLDVRINELSHAHRNQRFVIRMVHGLCVLDGTPVKVMSKSSIVRAHLNGAPSVSTPIAREKVPKRKRSDSEDSSSDRQSDRVVEVCRRMSSEMNALRTMCTESQAQAARLADTVTNETAMLRSEIATVAQAVQSLMSMVESLSGGSSASFMMPTPHHIISGSLLLSGPLPLPAPLMTPADVLKEPGNDLCWPLTHIS